MKSTQGNQDQSGQFGGSKRLDETSSNGHFAMNAKDDIQVMVVVHQDAITAKELAIWPETVGVVTNVTNLGI